MAIRKTIKEGNPILKAKNEVVKELNGKKVKQIVEDLVDTMRNVDLIGMAAPQIGENYQVFVTEPRKTTSRKGDQIDELRVYINPKIISVSGEKKVIFEGCGCVDDKFGPVIRNEIVEVEAYDLEGKRFRLKADGILGRVILHEYDHLLGLEFTNHVEKSKLISREEYICEVKNSKLQTENSIINLKEYRLV